MIGVDGSQADFSGWSVGDQLQVEIRAVDAVGNVGDIASATFTLAAVDLPEPAAPVTTDAAAEDALVAEYGVSAEEAAARIDRQPAVEDMDQHLSGTSSAFAGLWIDHVDGGKIKVATTQPGISAGVATQFGLPESLVAEVLVTRTLAQLTAVQDDITQRLNALPRPFAAPMSWIDIETNRVVLSVADPFDPAVQDLLTQLRAQHGDAFSSVVDPNPPTPFVCSATLCPPPLRGGLAIDGKIGTATSRCTGGFTAKNSNGTKFLLTAGHCLSGIWYHRGKRIGATASLILGGTGDIQAITVANAAFWVPENWIFRSAQSPSFTITSVARKATRGSTVCHFGRNTGPSCGRIVKTNARFIAPHPLTGAPITFTGQAVVSGPKSCGGPGDSGGPVFEPKRHRAYGVLSSGNVEGCGLRTFYTFAPLGPELDVLSVNLGGLVIMTS